MTTTSTVNLDRLLKAAGSTAYRSEAERLATEGIPATKDRLVPIAHEAIVAEYARLVAQHAITETSIRDAHLDKLALDLDAAITLHGDRTITKYLTGQLAFDTLLTDALLPLEDTRERVRYGMFGVDEHLRYDQQKFSNVNKVNASYAIWRQYLFNLVVPVLQRTGLTVERARRQGNLPDSLLHLDQPNGADGTEIDISAQEDP